MEAVPGMLKADWALFLELAAYTLNGLSGGVAFGIEEVTEAVVQGAVAVLFVPVSCGHGGEGAVRRVAATGGRGYIVGLAHDVHDDVSAWGAAAILRQPVQWRLGTDPRAAQEAEAAEPEAKRQKTEDAAVPKSGNGPADSHPSLDAAVPKAAPKVPNGADAAPATGDGHPAPPSPPKPENYEKQLKRKIKELGKLESLSDQEAIPNFAEFLRDVCLPQVGASVVFSMLGDAFVSAKGVAHRKAMVYAAHELLMRKRGAAMAVDDRRLMCLQRFFFRIGGCVRGFKADERHSYIRLVGAWQKLKVFQQQELLDLKDSWDVD